MSRSSVMLSKMALVLCPLIFIATFSVAPGDFTLPPTCQVTKPDKIFQIVGQVFDDGFKVGMLEKSSLDISFRQTPHDRRHAYQFPLQTEARSRSEEETMQGHRRRRATQ